MDKKQDALLKLLAYQHTVMGNVAAGLLVAHYRLHGKWSEQQQYAADRIVKEVEARQRRASQIMHDADKVGLAQREADAEQKKLEHVKDRMARIRLRLAMKSPR